MFLLQTRGTPWEPMSRNHLQKMQTERTLPICVYEQKYSRNRERGFSRRDFSGSIETVSEKCIGETTIQTTNKKSISLPIHILDHNIQTTILIDCGADDLFINQEFVLKNRIPTKKLEKPIPVRNVDGTPNKKRTITDTVYL